MSEQARDDVGAGVIDKEHRVQSELVRALLTVVDEAGDANEVLDALSDYSRAHFLSEELLMRLHAYPEYEGHCQDHERMMEELEAMRGLGADVTAMRHAAQSVAAAIRRHISTRDRRLGEYIANLDQG